LIGEWRASGLQIIAAQKRLQGTILNRIVARIACVFVYLRLLQRLRPRVIYSNTIRNAVEVVLGRVSGARTLVHVHEGAQMMRRQLWSLRLSSWFTSRYICVSTYSAEALSTLVHKKAIVVHNGVDSDCIETLNRSQRNSRVWRLAMAGGIQENKGQHIAIEAVAKLIGEIPAQLLIYGEVEDVAYRHYLDVLVERLDVKAHVEFRGVVASSSEIYDGTDIVVVASFDESFSRVLLEAFRYGCPVVASAVGGIMEIIRNEENGLLVPPGDVEALSGALRRLMNDSSLADKLRRTALSDVKTRFRLRDTITLMRSEIERLLLCKASPGSELP